MRRAWRRRTLLQSIGSGGLSIPILASSTVSGTQEEVEASVTFNDQTSDGREIVIAEIETSIDAMYAVRAYNQDEEVARGTLSAGTDRQDFTVRLDTPITDDRDLAFSLYPEGGGSSIARDTARVTVSGGVSYLDAIPVTRVEASPEDGFNYPFYYYAPTREDDGSEVPILVEPNNTGTSTDDFQRHEERARELISEGGFSRSISENLGVPMLVPVFPRPRSEPVDWRHYTHQLDRDTLKISSGPLERIDLQLLNMVEHAQEELRGQNHPVSDDILLNGFSASGNFVDRFTVLHPERVISVTAGGLNGMTILPLSEMKGRTLDYHVGIADVESITGSAVDLDALNDVNQLLYMGSEDGNDTIPYDDAWTSDELRETALAVYGNDMITERFPTCQSAYERAGVTAQFRVYEGAAHTPRPAREDIVEFHRRSIQGEDVSEFGQQLGLDASFDLTPKNPDVGDEIEFDASSSFIGRGEIVAFTWKFGDGETAAGPQPSHAYASAGTYSVRLRIVDSHGRIEETTLDLTVGEQASPTAETSESTDGEPATAVTRNTVTSTPSESPATRSPNSPTTTSSGQSGFGVITALTGVGSVMGYLLFSDNGEE